MDRDCLICKRIADIKEGSNPYFVKELKTGYIVVGDQQYYKGYTLFLCKWHVGELHDLRDDSKTQFLREMSEVAEAVYKVVKPNKLNYELLGNAYPHLHWHIFPRYKEDPNMNMPVWIVDKAIRNAPGTLPTQEQLQKLKSDLLVALK